MCHADTIGKVECARAFENDFDNAFDRQQLLFGGEILQRSTGNVLHNDVAEIFGDHGIVDLHDMWMLQLAYQRRFIEKQVRVHLAAFNMLQSFGECNLDGDVAPGKRIIGQIDRCCSAPADFANQVIFADFIHHERAIKGGCAPVRWTLELVPARYRQCGCAKRANLPR